MSKLFDTDFLSDPLDVFGGRAQSAAIESQEEQNAAEREAKLLAAEQARSDLFQLFPAAQENRALGAQGALDIFSRTIPQEIGAVLQGNIGAQRTLGEGLTQQQNALLGNQPVDLSSFNTPFVPRGLQSLDFDVDVPDFITSDEALNPNRPRGGPHDAADFGRLLQALLSGQAGGNTGGTPAGNFGGRR